MKVVHSFRILVFLAFCLAVAVPFSVAADQFKQIIVATGSPFELGLVAALAKAFEMETGCTVRCLKTPTGPGLELGRNGFAMSPWGTIGRRRQSSSKMGTP